MSTKFLIIEKKQTVLGKKTYAVKTSSLTASEGDRFCAAP